MWAVLVLDGFMFWKSRILLAQIVELLLMWCRCTMEELPGGQARVLLEGNDQGLAAGQFACFYQDGVCLGSAVIVQGNT